MVGVQFMAWKQAPAHALGRSCVALQTCSSPPLVPTRACRPHFGHPRLWGLALACAKPQVRIHAGGNGGTFFIIIFAVALTVVFLCPTYLASL